MHKLYNRQYFIHSIIVLLIMNLFFFLTMGDISSSGKFLFVRKSIVCAIAIYAVQFVLQYPFFHKRWAVNFLFFGWWYLFAFLKCIVIGGVGSGIYEKEIFIGTYGTAGVISLQYYIEKYTNNKSALFVLDAFLLLLCMPPVITYAHYLIYGYPIIYEEMMAVYNTNIKEAV